MNRLLAWLRALFCDHEIEIESIESSFDQAGERVVFACCWKCGKVFAAPYGLALQVKAKLVHRRRSP